VAGIDGLLLLMVLIWAGNYSLAKETLRHLPPLPFNAVRLTTASVLFLALLEWNRRAARRESGPEAGANRWGALRASPAISPVDWLALAGLGVVGHFVYQLCFIGGLARTSVSNSALILGCTPVAVAMLAAAIGQERVTKTHWAGAALSLCGLYLVAGRGAELDGSSLTGDLLMLVCIVCWAIYTVSSRPLLERHSPLVVTGYSMAFGTLLYVPVAIPGVSRVEWGALEGWVWAATFASAVLALNVAYLIWYTAVQRIGNARTSVYSNMVPVAAIVLAWSVLGERVEPAKWIGATAIVGGVVLTRLDARRGAAVAVEPPAEE